MKIIYSYLAAAALALLLAGAAAAQPAEDYARRGIGCFKDGDYTCAILNLNKAISFNPYLEDRLSPVLAKAYARRGAGAYREGQYGKAIADFDESIRLDPDRNDVRQARDRAFRAFEKPAPGPAAPVKDSEPEPPTPWFNLAGLVLLGAGAAVSLWMFWKVQYAARQKKKKIPAAQDLLLPQSPAEKKAEPKVTAATLLEQARALAAQQNYEGARNLLARKGQPDLQDYHLFLEIYVRLGDLMRAKLTASQIAYELETRPGNVCEYSLYFSLAEACKGEEWAALAHQLRQMGLSGMLKALPFIDAKEDYYTLGLSFEGQGETDLALKIYQQFEGEERLYKDVAARCRRLKEMKAPPPAPPAGSQANPAAPAPAAPGVNVYGQTLAGRYEVKGDLGEGGMGIVYEGWDPLDHKKVAIKRMHSWLKEYPEEYARFKKEAEIVSRLKHPNIIGVYGVIEQAGDVYLVFDYIAGRTLDSIIKETRGLRLAECKQVMQGVCGAVDYAHRYNIIHRDLKPANIMVQPDGGVMVMDFGLASELRDSMTRVTHHTMSGTPIYMAPEQSQGIVKKECDVYALGVCLYEMLTAKVPFGGADLQKQKGLKDYREVTALLPWLPSGIDQVIGRALEPEPEHRYASPLDFYADLEALK
jgi:tetratricopeptide (TPR) repeat protein